MPIVSEGVCVWAIDSFERLPSTQTHLVEAIRRGTLTPPCAVIAHEQTAGVGSRANRWEAEKGDLLVSIAVPEASMPDDLPVQSASIYFGWLMRETLQEAGATSVWLKWPNDLYQADSKIGGVVTHKLQSTYVVGIGVNLATTPRIHAVLRPSLAPMILLNMFLERLNRPPAWKHLFRKIQIEFEKSRTFFVHVQEETISMQDAVLCSDGAIEINGERIESLR